MVKLFRRFAVLAALLYWQGGFTFYAAVVVPVGTEVLGSRLRQAAITRHVTHHLNWAGVVALPILAWDAATASATPKWRRRLRWTMWALLAATLAVLVGLHWRLEAMFDAATLHVSDGQTFYLEHRLYLLVSTLQWLCALTLLVLSLAAWRAEDSSS